MANEIVFLVGRIIVGVFFIMNAMNHFMKYKMMEGYAKSKNVPAAGLMVIITGIMVLLGGFGVLTGVYTTYSIYLLVAFLLIVAFVMHNFWSESGDAKMIDMINFMKNLAIAGALLMILLIATPWPYSLL